MRLACILVVLAQSTGIHGWSIIGNAAAPPPAPATTLKPPSNVKLLILPGFGNDPVDYDLPQAPEGSLTRSLRERGWATEQIHKLPMRRTDWFRVFLRGCLDPRFWAGDAPPTRPAFAWYLQRIQSTVEEMCADSDDDAVVLVAHSAGGWLARAALGCGDDDDDDDAEMMIPSFRDRIAGLVTLGSPHAPPPPQVMDMTRGALLWTDRTYPGAYWRDVFYLTVMGDAIAGKPQTEERRRSPLERQTAAGFAYESYTAVCGEGTTRGDGVVPLCAGHLTGARQLTLPGVFHSINAPASWYGSDAKLDSWHDAMLQELAQWQRQKQAREQPQSIFGLFSR